MLITNLKKDFWQTFNLVLVRSDARDDDDVLLPALERVDAGNLDSLEICFH